MKGDLIAILVLVVVIAALVKLLLSGSEDCHTKGGVMLRTMSGFECVELPRP